MKNTEMHLLVIRTSAMGDVALTVPVIKGLREQYPDLAVTMLILPEYRSFFSNIGNLDFILPDFKNKYRGLRGIIKLFFEIRKHGGIDHIIDLHDVLRSKILSFLFRTVGVQVSVIDKGRKQKKDITRGRNKVRLKHTVERYCSVFADAGFEVKPVTGMVIIPLEESLAKTRILFTGNTGITYIGVAPYAKHALKTWPEKNMIGLLEMLEKNHKVKFMFFGGHEELSMLMALNKIFSGSELIAGGYSLNEELAIMSRLSFMIAMDSSNMHMAALVGTKVISIWGATDPVTGFGPWLQPDDFSIRIPAEDLTCRPCSVFGKGKCARGDFACMKWMTPENVYQKIDKLMFS